MQKDSKTKFLNLFLLIFLFLLANNSALAQSFQSAGVLKIIDGDTLRIQFQGREERIRLIGIDCPEARIDFNPISSP